MQGVHQVLESRLQFISLCAYFTHSFIHYQRRSKSEFSAPYSPNHLTGIKSASEQDKLSSTNWGQGTQRNWLLGQGLTLR